MELQELSVELKNNITVTGFEAVEVDLLIGELSRTEPDNADKVLKIDRT